MERIVEEFNFRLAMMLSGERVPALLQDQPVTKDEITHRRMNGKTLLRSSSLYRLKHFPGYLCRRCTGSSDIFEWLYTSRTRLTCLISAHRKQWRVGGMRLSVYLAVVSVVAQWVCAVAVASGAWGSSAPSASSHGGSSLPVPAGFCFLAGCLALIGAVATRLLHHFATTSHSHPD